MINLKQLLLESLEDKRDYLGTTFNGMVKAAPVKNARVSIHNDFNMISGVNSQNWRYIASKNQVLWNNEPVPEDRIKVDDYLARRGIMNPTHKNMYSRSGGYMKEGSDFIGSVNNGAISGEAVYSCYGAIHGDRTYHGNGWRYDSRKNRVLWSDVPDDAEKDSVNNWLRTRKIISPNHITYSELGKT